MDAMMQYTASSRALTELSNEWDSVKGIAYRFQEGAPAIEGKVSKVFAQYQEIKRLMDAAKIEDRDYLRNTDTMWLASSLKDLNEAIASVKVELEAFKGELKEEKGYQRACGKMLQELPEVNSGKLSRAVGEVKNEYQAISKEMSNPSLGNNGILLTRWADLYARISAVKNEIMVLKEELKPVVVEKPVAPSDPVKGADYWLQYFREAQKRRDEPDSMDGDLTFDPEKDVDSVISVSITSGSEGCSDSIGDIDITEISVVKYTAVGLELDPPSTTREGVGFLSSIGAALSSLAMRVRDAFAALFTTQMGMGVQMTGQEEAL